MRHYTHLSYRERQVIQKKLYGGENISIRAIARELRRPASTISREIKRNKTLGYNAREATQKAIAAKKRGEAM